MPNITTTTGSLIRSSKARAVVLLLTVLGVGGAGYVLGVRLVSQIHYHRGVSALHLQRYDTAARHFQNALALQPNEYRIWNKLGQSLYLQGGTVSPRKAYDLADRARRAYAEARACNRLDAEAAFGLATATERLESLQPLFGNGAEAHDARPLYLTALRLRPYSSRYRIRFIRYLSRKNEPDTVYRLVAELVSMDPLSCTELQQKRIWSSTIREAAIEGLQTAVRQGNEPREALLTLSRMQTGAHDYSAAIASYRQAIQIEAGQPATPEYLHLGKLYLRNGDLKGAEASFLKALLVASVKPQTLRDIYRIYGAPELAAARADFFAQAKLQMSGFSEVDILRARSLIELGQYRQAARILETLNRRQPSAEAYYWLAQIALKQKDRDTAAVAIQKAGLLDPGNSGYHRLFAEVLLTLKKYAQAEAAAATAIESGRPPSAGLYALRARIRTLRHNESGALEDWQTAINLKPDSPFYYVQAAEIRARSGQYQKALELYRQAALLDETNPSYQRRIESLTRAPEPTVRRR